MKKFLPLLLFLFLVGCGGPKFVPMDRAALPTLKGKTVSVVTHESPSFIAMTSGKGMFAVAGVGAAAAAGNKLVKEKHIEDPAPKVGMLVAEDLNSRFGLSSNGQPSKQAEADDLKEIAGQAAGNDYALDVMTIGWSYMYDGFHFSDYYVGCSVKLRLVDVATSEVLSAGLCAYDTKTAGKPTVSHDKLLENDAAYIKQTYKDASTYCADKFMTELF